MSSETSHTTPGPAVGASLLVSAPPERLYEVARDVRGFALWAPGVRRVSVLGGPDGPGMASEWEVSFLGLRKKVFSVLEEDEPPRFLRWTYDGPVRGWGECEIFPYGGGTLARFSTELHPQDPVLEKLMRTSTAKSAATSHLKRCLARLGEMISGDGATRVGPMEYGHQPPALGHQLLPGRQTPLARTNP